MAAGYEGLPFTPLQTEEFVRAEPEKEAAILTAKTEAGCGSKRKAEEDHEEAPAAVDEVVQWNGGGDDSEDEFYKEITADDSIYDFDSGDDFDPDERYAKAKAWFESRMELLNARYPGIVAKGEAADADDDTDDDGSLVVREAKIDRGR
ncbi:hypothetical protein D1007_17293 [Hordeum vulgare]|nr:hypothetical protein D1007_17293 [Hordeum vulgare]